MGDIDYNKRVLGLTSRVLEFYDKKIVKDFYDCCEECSLDPIDSIVAIDLILMKTLEHTKEIPRFRTLVNSFINIQRGWRIKQKLRKKILDNPIFL